MSMGILRSSIPLALVLALTACGGSTEMDADGRPVARGSTEALPAPQTGAGSVTGMPEPGEAGETGIVLGSLPSSTEAAAATGDADTGLAEQTVPAPATAHEPDANDAVQTLRNYFTRINAGDLDAARQLWREGQAPGQLVGEDVVGISAQIGEPSRIDAGAGQRFIEIPVTVQQTLADGQLRMGRGIYTLHASPVEGATPGWRISAAQQR